MGELAEMRSFDTNEHHAATARVPGSSNHHEYDSSIEESYSYGLWDQDKSMGCKCDPAYYGADCSLKKCLYGVDPLYYATYDGIIRQTTVVHGGSKGDNKGNIAGTFKIVFYDVFGERYVTKGITARGGTAEELQKALQALPNGVIFKTNPDVTATAPAAVTVSKQKTDGGVYSTTGGFGGGAEGDGAGLGTRGEYGSEYTITFVSTPGVLKSIELDTGNVNNPGQPEYWVANARAGEFSTRYTVNVGAINTLKYGKKYLFTNDDWTASSFAHTVAANDLIKVGGQEFRVTGADANRIVLDNPYLGASILPALTDTGVTAKSGSFTIASPGPGVDTLKILGGTCTTAIQAAALSTGAQLYINNCPMTSASTVTADASAHIDLSVNGRSQSGHECAADLLTNAHIIFRRGDPDSAVSQNMYKTSGDTAAATSGSVIYNRGEPNIYLTDPTNAANHDTNDAQALVKLVRFLSGTERAEFQFHAAPKNAIPAATAANPIFVNGIGPTYGNSIAANTGVTLTFDGAANKKVVTDLFGFNTVGGSGVTKFPFLVGIAGLDQTVTAGKVLLINGRRYRVRARGGSGATIESKITLSENFYGGQLRQLCASCVTGHNADGSEVTVTKMVNLEFGDRILISGYLQEEYATTVSEAGTDVMTIKTSNNALYGTKANIAGTAGAGTFSPAKDLYVEQSTQGRTTVSVVTEDVAGTTYQYVAQCSNRGLCDSATGLCDCFKGYHHENCDAQNMLAE